MDKKYTVKEVAELLGMTPCRVRRIIHAGYLKAEKGYRNMYFITSDALMAYGCMARRFRPILAKEFGMRFIMLCTTADMVQQTRHYYMTHPKAYTRLKEILDKKKKEGIS